MGADGRLLGLTWARLAFSTVWALSCLATPALGDQWTSIGPYGGSVIAFAISPSDANVILAGTANGGIFKSRDGGQNWSPRSNGLSDLHVTTILADPGKVSVFYAGTRLAGLFRSADAGETWIRIGGGSFPDYVHAIAVDPSSSSVMYVATDTVYVTNGGVFKTTDGGQTWQRVLGSSSFLTVAVDAAAPATVYAGGGFLWKSTDAGSTWNALSLDTYPSIVERVIVDPRNQATVYALLSPPIDGLAGYKRGLFRSLDEGKTWTKLAISPEDLPIHALLFDPETPATLYAGGGDTYYGGYGTPGGDNGLRGAFYKSEDSGRTWFQPSRCPAAYYANALAFVPGQPAALLVGVRAEGILRSKDRGGSWTTANEGLAGTVVAAVLVDPADPRRIFAAVDESGIYRSLDGGGSWQKVGLGIGTRSIRSLAVDRLDGGTLYAGAAAGVFKSTDGGRTWNATDYQGFFYGGLVVTFDEVRRLTVDPRTPRTLYANSVNTVFKTTDGGAKWFDIGITRGLPSYIPYSFAISPADPATIFVGNIGDGVYRSRNGGASWSYLGGFGGFSSGISPHDPSKVYSAYCGVSMSSDGGDTWSLVPSSPPCPVYDLAFDPVSPATMYAAVDDLSLDFAGVWMSTDGGLHWAPALTGHKAIALATDSAGTLYAGTSGGGVVRRDGATTKGVAATRVVVAPVASLHGAGDAFFHSDLVVLNPSPAAVDVALTYRCFPGQDCGGSPARMTLEAGEEAVFNDVVASLFGSTETAGSLELDATGPVVVSSRLYTPSKPAATFGMFVPARAVSEAAPLSVLSGLSHSANAAVGFRTNVGAYNPASADQIASFEFVDRTGSRLGILHALISGRSTVQLNDRDTFEAIGINRDIPDFYCLVRSEGGGGLLAYASVVDNQTQDPFLVVGQAPDLGRPASVLLPVVASLPGANGSFFHSDVQVYNPSGSDVAARLVYRCLLGNCGFGNGVVKFAAGTETTWDDFVATELRAPSTAGALWVHGADALVVTSRLYTPDRSRPTVGQSVPAVKEEDLGPALILTPLSHSADPARRFRTNIGIYNNGVSCESVALEFFDAKGRSVGILVEAIAAQQLVQLNDAEIFGRLGVGDVENLYCVVRGGTAASLFSYASVVDNQSQDLILLPGQKVRSP